MVLEMIKLTPIKPNARAINFSRFGPAAKRGIQDAAEDVKLDIEATTASWSHDVPVTIKERTDGYSITVDDAVWKMLDVGTRAHLIVARKAKRLRFFGGFKAKTRPGFIGSTSGGASGGPVFRRAVQHPGTTARGWSKLIGAKYRSRLQAYISKRIKEAA